MAGFALYISQYFPDYVGGGERLVQLTAAGLSELDQPVTVITGGRGPDYCFDGVPVRRVPLLGESGHWTDRAPEASALDRVLDDLRPSIVQTTGIAGLHVLATAARRHGAALGVAATEYGAICEHRTLVRPSGSPCDGPVSLQGCFECGLETMRRRDRVLAQLGRRAPSSVSQAVARAATRAARRPLARQLTWWHEARFLDARRRDALSQLDAFIAPTLWTRDLTAPHLAPRTAARAIMHPLPDDLRQPEPKATPNDVLRVGFVGRPLPFKGLHVLLRAIESLAGRAPVQIEVHAPSNQGELGDYWRPLRERIARIPSSSWHERGVLSAADLRALHRGIDVLAVPSTWPEWLGLVTLEAQGLGTPVILSDLPSQRDLASGDGRSSWFVPPGDAAALARTLVDVWEAKRSGRLEAPQPRCPSPAEYARELLEVYRG